jgi:hypothetical protein
MRVPANGRLRFSFSAERSGVLSVVRAHCEPPAGQSLVCLPSGSAPSSGIDVQGGDVLFLYPAIYSVDPAGNAFELSAQYEP